uniref:Uncharacterized protein n=1 Tax=Ananas comosus var. bracteatus TaxID=296719 RepID=A0A6V7QWU6_ANACO
MDALAKRLFCYSKGLPLMETAIRTTTTPTALPSPRLVFVSILSRRLPGLSLLFPEDETHSIIHVLHPRRQLHRLCWDDPAFGLWDPSEGISLEWSDGHVWTVDVPGPNRTLQIWETTKSIVVSEDWYNAENIHVNEIIPDIVSSGTVVLDNVNKLMEGMNDEKRLSDGGDRA